MICPFSKKKCKEKECPLWVKLYLNTTDGKSKEEHKCAIAWIPTILVELKKEKQNN